MEFHPQGHFGSFARPTVTQQGPRKPGSPFATGAHYNNGSTATAPGLAPGGQHGFNSGVLTGPLNNPFASVQPPISQMAQSRGQMKDQLAESLAADTNISIIPGFSPQLQPQLNSAEGFPICIMNNSTTSRSPNQYHAVRNVQATRNADFPNAGFKLTQPSATGASSHNSTLYYAPTWSDPMRLQGPTGNSSNAQINFRRGRSGSWAHFGSSDQDARNTPEAKAKRESYRHELEKQIEQAKLRRQEAERREKDLNDHPLGSNYAQPKQYSHPKFQSASSTALAMGPRTTVYEEQLDVTGRCTQQPPRSRSQPRPRPNQLEETKGDYGSCFRQNNTEMDPRQQSFPCPLALPPPWPPVSNPPIMPFPYPPPFYHPVQPPFPGSALPPPIPPPPMVSLPSPRLPPPVNQPPLWQPSPGLPSPHNLESSSGDSAVTERLTPNFSAHGAPHEEADKLDNAEEILRQHTWQTSDQLPDPALKVAIYKEELRRQIIQKKKDEEVRALKEKEEEEKLERKIREHEERMKREVVEEKNRIYARSGCRVNQVENFRRTKEITEDDDRIRLEENVRQEQRRREIAEQRKTDTIVFEEYIRDGRGDNHEVTRMTERSNSPPIPTVQKRLQSRQCNSYRFPDSARLSSAQKTMENKNLSILSDMLNSLDLETRRIERAIRRKMNY